MIKLTKKLTGLKMENAQTFVEFALVFPIVLLITYGIIEFGRLVFIYASVTGAAREGARYGAASGSLTTPYFKDCDGIINAAQRGAILTPIIIDRDTDIWYDKGPDDPSHLGGYTCDTLPVNAIKLGYRIVVRVTVHYAPIIPFLGVNGRDFEGKNARTILVNIPMVTPGP